MRYWWSLHSDRCWNGVCTYQGQKDTAHRPIARATRLLLMSHRLSQPSAFEVSFRGPAAPFVPARGLAGRTSASAVFVAPHEALRFALDGVLAGEVVNQGSVTQQFGHDLAAPIGMPPKIAGYSGASLCVSHFFGSGSNQPMDLIVGGVSCYYHRDAFGSTTTVTDPFGVVQPSYNCDAWGSLVRSADNVRSPYRWDGPTWDGTTELIRDGARFYDPATGRYLTPGSDEGCLGSLKQHGGDLNSFCDSPGWQSEIGSYPQATLRGKRPPRRTFTEPSRDVPYRRQGASGNGKTVTRSSVPFEGSYQHLNGIVIAFLQGRQDVETSVRAIVDSHSLDQVKAVLFNEGERYRRFNRARFRDLVERLRTRGVLW